MEAAFLDAKILIVDDEKNTREGLSEILEGQFEVLLARDAQEAFDLLDNELFDVVITDLRMAGKSGMSVIDKALQMPYAPICIMMTAYPNVEVAVEAMKRGAFDFLTKPISIEKLEILIKRALESRSLKKENVHLHQRLDQQFQFQNIIGNSKSLVSVLEDVRQVATTKATVLLTGETGTGKELIAQMIHQNSPRAHAPFIAVHCAALPANLLESELFGHEKGAFTGAKDKRIGRFESAHKGSLFLDEIGEIDAITQIKLLRFLETKTFERVGSNKPITVDVRLIVATHKNLEAMVKSGTFREDLYYRLNVVHIELPALRQRSEDIPVLLNHYLRFFAFENHTTPVTLTPKALQILQAYKWPGNIRELRNFCETSVVMKRSDVLSEKDLEPKFFVTQSALPAVTEVSELSNLSSEDNERKLFQKALQEAKGNKTLAAQLMGISRRTLHRKLHKWSL
jgi:two-component system response regulator AtoC